MKWVFGLAGIGVVVNTVILWAVISLGVSLGKKAFNECGKTWRVEVVFPGDWFCPK